MPITINGSGTVTGISAGGLPDDCITTADIAAGAVTVPKITGGPAFSAYLGSSQTITDGVTTKLAFNAEHFDTNNNFDSTTNYRFTPLTAGYYQINLTVYMTSVGGANTGVINTSLFKNGSVYSYGTYRLIGNFAEMDTSSWLVYMNGSTDYLEAYFVQTSGGSRAVASGATAGCIFSGTFARPA
jgi:hypothetical protein